MNLQEMLGDAFREGMSIEEINTALSGKKFADLSTGAYVDKNKYEADIKAKNDELKKKSDELTAKMSTDELAKAKEAEKDKLIETLKKQVFDSQVYNSKSTAEAAMAASKTTLGIPDNDTAYDAFLSSIATDNVENTKTLATYINKLIQDSYKKGKDDASKNNLGKFSKNVGTASSDNGNAVENYGTQLAKASVTKTDQSNLYFK